MAVWDVGTLPAAEQFDYWREVICQAFVPLAPRRPTHDTGFAGHVETRPLGTLNRALLSSQAQETVHGPKEVSRTCGEYFFVNLQLDGNCRVSQSGVESIVEPGQFTVVDTTQPYSFNIESSWRMLSFRVPRSRISTRLARPRFGMAVGIAATSGIGSVASSLMHSLWDLGDVAGASTVAELEDSFAAAVAAALGAVEPSTNDSSLRIGMRTAILAFVRTNVGNPSLSVASVCRQFSISPRTLHKLFAGHDESFASTVRSVRLERCARLLTDPSCRDSITEIAARHGFGDPASFSRAFRRHHGVAPREMRQTARTAGRNAIASSPTG